jgi:hypothetical protein
LWGLDEGERPTSAKRALTAELRAGGIQRALVFYNDSDLVSGAFGGWRATLDPLVQRRKA